MVHTTVTVEPLKIGHFFHCREVVLFLEVLSAIGKVVFWDPEQCPLLKGLTYSVPFLEGPFFEVLHNMH